MVGMRLTVGRTSAAAGRAPRRRARLVLCTSALVFGVVTPALAAPEGPAPGPETEVAGVGEVQAAPAVAGPGQRFVFVLGTGVPKLDRQRIRSAVDRVAPFGTVALAGRFNLGLKCVLCVRLTKPMTITGVGTRNPAWAGRPRPWQVTRIQGGIAPFWVNQQTSGPAIRRPAIRVQNLWFRRQVGSPIVATRSLDRLEFVNNRVSNIEPIVLATNQFRFGFGSANIRTQDFGRLLPGGLGAGAEEEAEAPLEDEEPLEEDPPLEEYVEDDEPLEDERLGDPAEELQEAPGAATIEELEQKYPGIEPLTSSDPFRLEGALVLRGNRIDLLTRSKFPFVFGDDNAVGIAGCQYSSISIEQNYFASRGEMEIEGCEGSGARYRVAGNTVRMNGSSSTENTISANFVGGHPAAIKTVGNPGEVSLEVVDNDVTVTGTRAGVAVLAGTSNPDAVTLYARNTIRTDGQRTAFLGGFPGIPGFFPASSLQNAQIRDNTFLGTARTAIGFRDIRWLLTQNLVNRANRVDIRRNDMTGLTVSGPALRFDPSTFDNTFAGNPNGPIDDRGTNNTITVTP